LKPKPYLKFSPMIARNTSAKRAETPFVSGPISDKIGPFADNEYCDAVLNGTFDFEDIAEMTEVHDLIAGMRYPHPSHPTTSIDTTLTYDGFQSAIVIHVSANHPPPLDAIMDTTAPCSDPHSS
jgi:hypothetical protein